MKQIKVMARTVNVGSDVFGIIEVEDDATEEEMEAEARETALDSLIEWNWEVVE